MTLKQALLDGAQDALAEHGLGPAREKSTLRKALPWLAAGGAGLAGYKYLHTPVFSMNPALRAIQERAVSKGFHRVVDVTPTELDAGASLKERLEHFVTPHADAEGHMGLAERVKMFLREGTTDSIPVTQIGNRQHVPGHKGPKKVDGVVWNRKNVSSSDVRPIVRGGIDVEGPDSAQRSVTALGRKGKGAEADLVQMHAPDAMPLTHSDVTQMFDGLKELPPGQAAQELQSRMRSNIGDDFMMKPTQGLASGVGGRGFPHTSNDDWGHEIEKFHAHLADPVNKAAFKAADTQGGNATAHYLRDNNIYKGHVLHEALRKPRSIMAQKVIPDIVNEYRVHTIAGSAPRSMLLPRGYKGVKGHVGAAPTYMGVGKHSDEVNTFVEDLMQKLPKKYRDGNFAVDVVSHKRPDGTLGHKLVEMNPTESANTVDAGGGSGYLEGIGHRHHHAVTGRHTPLLSGLGGLGAAGIAGAATEELTDDH